MPFITRVKLILRTLFFCLALLFPSVAHADNSIDLSTSKTPLGVNLLLPQVEPAPDFDREVLAPLREHQAEIKAACDAKAGTLDGLNCVEPIIEQPAPATYQYSPNFIGLSGSLGYALPWGNCVNEPGVNNPGWGNPINWPATSWQPWIGATALFTYNHVGVVTGIWSNGDLEIRHQNFYGGVHRFPRWALRGFR